MSPTAVGYYDVAWKLTLPVMFVAQTAGSALMSKMSALDAADEATNTDIVNTLSFSGVLAVPAFVGFLLLHTEVLVTAFGSEYTSAWPLLIGLAAYRVVATQSQPLINALNGLDRPDITMWITGTTVAGNVVLGVVLTLYYGPVGVVIATFLAEFARYIAAIVIIHREVTPFSPVSKPVVQQIASAVVMGAGVALTQQFVTVASWVDLGILVGVGAAVYWLVLLSISKQLRTTLQSAFVGMPIDLP
ncbi:polysaccharide biosynthesis C-terminal domain-containing protein [Halomicroarcula sp. GCM10025894]